VKDVIADLIGKAPSGIDPRNVVREYLQGRILESLQRAGAMVPLAFMGGTALRFLYRTPRYSEDLDFSLEREPGVYDLGGWLRRVRQDLTAESYDVEIALKSGRSVDAARVAFPRLLFELGLSAHPAEKLMVKLEVDTHPPAGAGLEVTLVRRATITLRLQHHDRESLLAGKINALLTRDWLKGRDVYDLVWYLADADWPSPNLVLLNNALAQFDSGVGPLAPATWRSAARDRLAGADWNALRADVRPFLERPDDIAIVSEGSLQQVLRPE
jgi:predicted nucleotidyltransferase component of viral defense system